MPRQRVRESWTALQRIEFYSMPEPNSGCWLWFGSTDRRGYSQLRFQGRLWQASQLSLISTGASRPSLEFGACHKCDNPACVNPEHLFWGTQKDNVLDMRAKGRGNLSGLDFGRGHNIGKTKPFSVCICVRKRSSGRITYRVVTRRHGKNICSTDMLTRDAAEALREKLIAAS